jgi:hypothetical protein
VTISLLEAAMLKGGKQQVLIDGFPRNEENRAAFESQVSLYAKIPPLLSRRSACMQKSSAVLRVSLHAESFCCACRCTSSGH